MRTTVTLDQDVAAAVERLRREEGVGVSTVVNRLVRAALARKPERTAYVHQSETVGLKVDVSNIGAVEDLLDELP